MAADPEGIGEDVRGRLTMGSSFDDATVRAAWATQREFQAELQRAFTQVDVIVTPTLSIFPPLLEEGDDLLVSRCTLAGQSGGGAGLVVASAERGSVARQHPARRARRAARSGSWPWERRSKRRSRAG